MTQVYLDNAASTSVDKKVLKKMLPYFSLDFGNGSALHFAGEKAKQGIEESRTKIASALGIEKNEVIFTSGATESNNLIIKGVFKAITNLTKYRNQKLHFITTTIEHNCVLKTLEFLVKQFPQLIEVDFLQVNSQGLISPDELIKKVKKNTVLVSVMFVNNEIGIVEPIKEIGEKILILKKQRDLKKDFPLYFHSDAVQAFAYYDCNFSQLNLDAITLSAHKIYGPKGVGVLGMKNHVLIDPIIHGGGQEQGKRSGTYNTPGIIGVGEAIHLTVQERKKNFKKIKNLRDYLTQKIQNTISDIKLNHSLERGAPHIANISFKGIEGESAVLLLSQEGIAAATGSACSSASLKASHVQLAIGNSHLQAHGSLRFSLSKYTTKKDLDFTVIKLEKVIKRLREISRGL